ncbi:hypothetical protein [Achromobacter xylosoxidans]|uniref:hypothetical protein n=1 Tax=Alcaligenes xylosoxydans xylosoxydans TaxID=85698 RepID=UPI001EEB91FA|nr:hypothetical protein [Achromobacter xylosoxidans]
MIALCYVQQALERSILPPGDYSDGELPLGLLPAAWSSVGRRVNEKGAEAPFSFTVREAKQDHSHSIINKSLKPTWLKGFAVIDMGPYRRFYRQKRSLI